jgi:hypothetical protein
VRGKPPAQRAGSLELTVGSRLDAATWDADAEHLGGSVFHSYAWGAYRARTAGGTALYASWRSSADGPAASAVGIVRSVAPGIRVVEFDAAPARTSEAPSDLATSLTAWARDRSALEIGLGSYDSHDSCWRNGGGDGDRVEFLVEPGRPDDLRRRMRKGARSSISRARRLGVEAAVGAEGDIREFVTLYAATVDGLRARKGVRMSLDRERLADGLKILLVGGRARLYIARQQGTPVAACVFGCFGRSAYYLLNGAGGAARSTGATPYLLHSALSDLSEDGYTSLNLGGVASAASDPSSLDHGLYQFKLGLGGTPVACSGERVTLRPALAAAAATARRLVRR